jgi:AcrR family transcriptional regulator
MKAARTTTKRAPAKRAYRMSARAEAAEQTTKRIYAAAVELFTALPFAEVTLRAVAERAAVTLQTVLRKFRSKEALFEEAATTMNAEVFASRIPPRAGDVRSAVETLVASYEAMGDLGWRGLCQEDQFDFVKQSMDRARSSHRAWVESTFAQLLPKRAGAKREQRVLLLFAATDFYVWKLYRRDLGIGREATVERMIDLVLAISVGLR